MTDDAGDNVSSARAKAEARRQRILAASGERMGVVSGGTEGDTSSAADAAAAGATAGGEGGSGKSKYAAARRRRYGKKAPTATAAAPAAAESEEKPVEEPAASAPGQPAETESEEPAAATAAEGQAESTGEKKKYMGVAKMRRKMLAEKKKKKKQEEEQDGADAVPTGGGERRSPSGRKLGVPKSISSVARDTAKRHRSAVLMQLFTLALLFLTGLGVGIQNHALNDGIVVVTNQLSLSENGVGALRILGLGGGGETPPDATAKAARERLLEEEEEVMAAAGEDVSAGEDEFGDDGGGDAMKPKGVGGDDGSSQKVPNIDPLFRVDLDELTSGPGFLSSAARVAVKFHRTILYLVLDLPLTIVQSLLALPRALMANPPILFIAAVIIRFVGRDLLGAHLPELDAGGEDEGKDIVTSMKNMFMNFLSASFPNAAKILEVLRDARQDMFVVLCGLFVGLVLPIHLGKEDGKDEL